MGKGTRPIMIDLNERSLLREGGDIVYNPFAADYFDAEPEEGLAEDELREESKYQPSGSLFSPLSAQEQHHYRQPAATSNVESFVNGQPLSKVQFDVHGNYIGYSETEEQGEKRRW